MSAALQERKNKVYGSFQKGSVIRTAKLAINGYDLIFFCCGMADWLENTALFNTYTRAGIVNEKGLLHL